MKPASIPAPRFYEARQRSPVVGVFKLEAKPALFKWAVVAVVARHSGFRALTRSLLAQNPRIDPFVLAARAARAAARVIAPIYVAAPRRLLRFAGSVPIATAIGIPVAARRFIWAARRLARRSALVGRTFSFSRLARARLAICSPARLVYASSRAVSSPRVFSPGASSMPFSAIVAPSPSAPAPILASTTCPNAIGAPAFFKPSFKQFKFCLALCPI